MFKKFFSLLMSIVLIFSIVGCQNKEVNKPDDTSTNVNENKVENTQSNSSDTESSDTENEKNSSVPMKTVTVEIPTDASGLYLNSYSKDTTDTDSDIIDSKYTLNGDKTIKYELKLGKYEFVWGDEFDGNALNTSIWSDYDSESRGSDQKITMDAITVSNGILKCTATRYYDPLNSSKKWKTAPSISTDNSMVFQHGYLEMRARVPYKQGGWPSFWLTSGSKSPAFRDDFPNKEYAVELDIFEIINSTDTMTTTLHKWFTDGSHNIIDTEGYSFVDTTNLSDEYHIYAFEWTSNAITLYIDGTKWYTYDLNSIYEQDNDSTKGFDQYMKIILGVGTLISPNFKPDADLVHLDQGDRLSDLPFEYCIDWIRLYQEPGKKAIQYLS